MKIIKKGLPYAIAIAVALLIIRYDLLGLERHETSGKSMQPTIYDTDNIKISKVHFLFNNVEIGDIVSVESDKKNVNYIKRVVAKEGDTISIDGFNVYINNKEMKYVCSDFVITPKKEKLKKYVLKKNEYYVLGDNRNNSTDSRVFGIITKDIIVGKLTEVNGKKPKEFIE